MSATRLVFTFADNNGKESTVGFWLPDTLPLSDVGVAANVLRSAMLPVTSARLLRAEYVYEFRYPDPNPAAPESDLRRRMLFFFTNESYRRSISVPSPAELPLDSVGAYSGIRLQRRSILLSPVLTALETIASNTVDEQGRPFPGSFSVGGITRQ